MAIPESQLETWSSLGSITQSKNTYATIKGALEAKGTPYAAKDYEWFLQGSYGNDTNVYSDSDVDVVMKIDAFYYRDLTRLSPDELKLYKSVHGGEVQYGFADFKRDVTKVLRDKFGADVNPGQKAVWIKPNGARRNSDVLVAAQFRRHKTCTSSGEDYEEGIGFLSGGGALIENFPKQHSATCTTKHKATESKFKPTVRIFKNMRNRMIKDGTLQEGIAPSYFLEGMLYEYFTGTYNDIFVACFNWIFSAERDKLICANGLHLGTPSRFAFSATGRPTFWWLPGQVDETVENSASAGQRGHGGIKAIPSL